MNTIQTIKNTILGTTTLADLERARDAARRRSLDASATYAEDPTDKNWAAKEAADRVFAQTDTRLRERQRADAEAQRQREAAERAKRQAELEAALKTAASLPALVAADRDWFVATYREARARHRKLLAAQQEQVAACHRAGALARELGVEVDVPSPAHPGTLAGIVGRAIGEELRQSGDDARVETFHLFRPHGG